VYSFFASCTSSAIYQTLTGSDSIELVSPARRQERALVTRVGASNDWQNLMQYSSHGECAEVRYYSNKEKRAAR
jgi:hypothetical protein